MDRTKRNIIGVIAFVIFFSLVTHGQKNIGMQGLTEELIGMFGLIYLLYRYNKRYK